MAKYIDAMEYMNGSPLVQGSLDDITPYRPGPRSIGALEEMEREKRRRELRANLSKKRSAIVQRANEDRAPDFPELQSSPNMIEQRAENTRPELKSGIDRFMPYDAPVRSQSELDEPMYTPPVSPQQEDDEQEFADMPDNMPDRNSRGGDEFFSTGGLNKGSNKPRVKLDSRKMLYDYLTNRRKSEPEFQQQYRNLSNDAETGRVLNTFASGLGEMASMAGTLGGKRADTGDMKALPNAIYGSMRKQADETLGLRRLENQEQVSDIRMLRDLEKGDLDNLRIQKILADLERKKNQPKITPFFNFGDPEKNVPPSAVVMNDGGQFNTQPLPMGTMPTNSGFSAGPTLYDQQNNPILSQAQKSTGQYKFTPGPAGTKTPEIMRIENDSQAKEASLELSRLKNEMTNANAQERNELQRKVFELDKKIQGWKESQGNRSGDQRDRALDIQEDKANNPRPGKDVAGETLDKTFAKDYEQYVAMGGKDLLMQKLATLKNARDNLAKINPPPRAAGALGEAGIDLFAPEYAEIMSSVRGAIQETLRQTLGSQFTEKEGERILARSFNPRQTKEANLRNIDREIQNLVGRAKAKQASVDYYEKNGTLRGFKSDSGASGGAPKKQHNFKLNKTRFTYPDGRVEEKEGIL